MAKEGLPSLSRRQALRYGAATAATLAIGSDRLAGVAYQETLSDTPTAALIDKGSRRDAWSLVVGGLANDGIAVAECMKETLRPHGAVVGLRYAQTNLDPTKLYDAVAAAKDRHNLPAKTHLYLGSAALVYMAKPLTELAQDGTLQPDCVILDSCPANADDVKGISGELIRARMDTLLGPSRLFNAYNQWHPAVLPSLSDRDASVPYAALLAHQTAIHRADTAVIAMESSAIRDSPLRPGSLEVLGRAAQSVHYVRAEHDPLINSASAEAEIQRALGSTATLIDHVDPYRRPDSHAAGPEHPLFIGQLLTSEGF